VALNPSGSLPEAPQRVAARHVEALERAVRRAGSARDGSPRREADRVGQGDERVGRYADDGGVAAVARHAVHDDALTAELGPADAAVLAPPAALVVMDHHALAGGRVRFGGPRPAIGDDATRLVARDDGPAAATEAEGRGGVAGGAGRSEGAPPHAPS